MDATTLNVTTESNVVAVIEGYRLSNAMREFLSGRKWLPKERELLELMILDSFDRGLVSAPLRLEYWAGRLNMRDAGGLRVDKLRKVLWSLSTRAGGWGVVDIDEARGCFSLRPHPDGWLKAETGLPSDRQQELRLCAERPLSDTLSGLSREKALGGGLGQTVAQPAFISAGGQPERSADPYIQALRDAVGLPGQVLPARGNNAAADKSAESDRRLNSPDENPVSADKSAELKRPVNTGGSCPADKFADPAIASSALKDQKAQLAKAADKSAGATRTGQQAQSKEGRSRAAMTWLEEVDESGDLRTGWIRDCWEELCRRDPDFVLRRLRGAYEDNARRVERAEGGVEKVYHALAWLGAKARGEKMLSWRRK